MVGKFRLDMARDTGHGIVQSEAEPAGPPAQLPAPASLENGKRTFGSFSPEELIPLDDDPEFADF